MKKLKLYHDDCLERMDKLIAKGVRVDAIITDPPYGTTACGWDNIIPFNGMWERLNRILKPQGVIVLFGNEPFSSALRMSNIRLYKYDWIWLKESPSNFFQAKFCPLSKIENISIFGDFGVNNGSKKLATYNPQGVVEINQEKITSAHAQSLLGREHKSSLIKGTKYVQKFEGYPSRIIKFNRDRGAVHPTQKPIALMEYLIKTYTDKGETVLDFTMGSGTTGIACVNTKRKFIGIERDKKYFKIAKKRIQDGI